MKQFLLATLIISSIAACGSSATAVSGTVATTPEKTTESPDKKTENTPAPTQKNDNIPDECKKPWGKTTEDSLKSIRNAVLFQDEIKAKNYPEAYIFWTYLVTKAPCATVRPYQEAPALLGGLMGNPDYASRAKGLLDTLFWSFPQRIKYHGEEGLVKSQWAYYLYYYKPTEYKQLLGLCKDVVSIMGNQTQYHIPSIYMTAIIYAFNNKEVTKEDVLGLYDQLSKICSYNIAQNGSYLTQWQQAQTSIDETAKPFLKCEDIDQIFGPRIQNEPDNLELKKTVIKYYRGGRCSGNENYIKLLMDVFKVSADAGSAEEIAIYYETKGNEDKAIEFWNKALELNPDAARHEYYYTKLAANAVKSNCASAINYANKVLAINPNNGQAYIILGIAKFKCAQSSCSDFNRNAAAWVAVDYFNKAIAVDPNVKEDATKYINQYRSYYPTQDQCFFNNLKDGQSYTIDCMGATTTVRSK